jgi:urease beta subunit
MRKLLLTSAAVTALLAGTALAPAQTRQDHPSQQPAAASHSSSPQGRAMEEKGSRAGDRRETTGASRDQSSQKEPSGTGASDKSNDKAAGSDRNTSGATGSDSKPSAADKAEQKDSNKGTTQRSDRQKGAKSSPSSATGAKQETGGNAPRQDTATGRKTNDAKTNSSAQKSDRSTAGQSPPNARSNANSNNTSNQSDPRQPSSGSSSQTNSQSDNRTGSQQSTNGRTGSTTASVEQQTKFNEVIRRQNIRSVTNVNFSVSVGTAIPTSVHVYDVPREIVTIYPEYRGKKFVVVRDEIVIIEPGTRKIVSVIPRSGRATTGATTSTTTKSSRLNLAPEKRRMIRETVIKEQSAPRCSDVTVTVGETVSSSLRLDPLPSLVVQDVPEIRSYEFCIKDNDVVLVDPGEHRIIDVID